MREAKRMKKMIEWLIWIAPDLLMAAVILLLMIKMLNAG